LVAKTDGYTAGGNPGNKAGNAMNQNVSPEKVEGCPEANLYTAGEAPVV